MTAAKSVDESKMILRMSDLISEPQRMLPPIKGYEKEPLVSLEQAVEPLLSLVPEVKDMVWTVKQNCQHPANDLSSDESASIMLYTLEWMPREKSFYFILNETLRSENRHDLLPWFLYLQLFIFSLAKLPPTKHRIVYRGIKMDLTNEFPDGKTFIWWAFSSCTSSIKVLEQFLGQNGHRTIFNIECDAAKDISQHSFFKKENEVLLYPARQFQVDSSYNPGNQLKIIHLKEVRPPFSLIHIPQTSAPNVDQSQEIQPSLSMVQISQASSTNSYQNKRVQQLFEQRKSNSEMDLENQDLNDKDMELVVKEAIMDRQCKVLRLSSNQITSVGASIIAKALNNNITLENLTLYGNRLSDDGVQVLTKTLALNNSKVDTLDLQSTGITDEGAEHIAEMLKTNTTLKCLSLDNNEISDVGVQHLANVLTHHNTTLKSLSLYRNKLTSDSNVDALVEMLKQNQTLTYLDIEGCALSGTEKKRLREVVRSKRGFDLRV